MITVIVSRSTYMNKIRTNIQGTSWLEGQRLSF